MKYSHEGISGGLTTSQLDLNEQAMVMATDAKARVEDLSSSIADALNRLPAVKVIFEESQLNWLDGLNRFLESSFPGKDKRLIHGSSYPMESSLAEKEYFEKRIAFLTALVGELGLNLKLAS